MPRQERHKTNYPGVYFIVGTHPVTGKDERIYYITYRLGGKRYEEKAGRQNQDGMTPARASLLRARKINREKLPNIEQRREAVRQSSSMTLNELLDDYLATNRHLKHPETAQYRFDKHIRNRIGHLQPREITTQHIDRLSKEMSADYKPQSVSHVLALIVRLTNYGVERTLCEPLRIRIKKPRFDNTKTEMLSPDQLVALEAAIDSHYDPQVRGFYRLALYTGMRHGELLKLRWDDIDFVHRIITIRDPKGVVTENIPMNDHTEAVLHDLSEDNGTPLVFPSPNGGMRCSKSFYPQARVIRKRAGLPDDFRPFHGARHAYASILASNGVDLYTIQKLLGHKSPQMTQRYAHLQDETLRRATGIIDKVIKTDDQE